MSITKIKMKLENREEEGISKKKEPNYQKKKYVMPFSRNDVKLKTKKQLKKRKRHVKKACNCKK